MRSSKSKASRATGSRSPKVAAQTYHGVRLQKPTGKTRFSAEELTKAVDVAIAKNARILAGER